MGQSPLGARNEGARLRPSASLAPQTGRGPSLFTSSITA
jgi:hypothetical protein